MARCREEGGVEVAGLMTMPPYAVDPEAEHLIQAALARLVAERTVLVIAHRLSTIRHAA